MKLKQINFSKTLTDSQVYDCIVKNYGHLAKAWVLHQWNWMNYVYAPFKDHTKYFILIFLIEKTLQFYDQMNINYNFNQFYSKKELSIEKFSISEICEKISIPKETVRRKVLELQELGVLKRKKKQIIIDRSAFTIINPNQQLKVTASYIALFTKQLGKDETTKNIYPKNLGLNSIETIIKNNFSLCLRWFCRMQLNIILSYNRFFTDTLSFHIYGTVIMNQVFNLSKSDVNSINLSSLLFSEQIFQEGEKSSGLSAMSISDMTRIPRATVVRKCKYLMKENYLQINNKKQFIIDKLKSKDLKPHQQQEAFKNKAKFLRKVLNLIMIS